MGNLHNHCRCYENGWTSWISDYEEHDWQGQLLCSETHYCVSTETMLPMGGAHQWRMVQRCKDRPACRGTRGSSNKWLWFKDSPKAFPNSLRTVLLSKILAQKLLSFFPSPRVSSASLTALSAYPVPFSIFPNTFLCSYLIPSRYLLLGRCGLIPSLFRLRYQ